MSKTKSLCVLAGVAIGAWSASAQTDTARGYGAELAADAAARTGLRTDGGASWNNGATISDGTGDHSLRLNGYMIFRYSLDFRDDGVVGSTEDFTHGFFGYLTKFILSGSIYEKALTYKVQVAFAGSGSAAGSAVLDDAYGQYAWDGGTHVRWGQFKLPVLKEDNISDTHSLAAGRSLMSDFFRQNRTQGIQVGHQGEQFRVMGAFSDGHRAVNTAYNSTAEADLGLTARGEFMWDGTWKQFDQFTSWQSAESACAGLAGAAIHWDTGGETGGPTTDMDRLLATADVMVQGRGWNAFGAFVMQDLDSPATDFTDYGGQLQGGVFVTEQAELFAQWNAIFLDADRGAADDDMHFVTAGVNYYVSPESQAARFTGDVTYSLNDTSGLGAFLPDQNAGLLGQADSGELLLRLQFQEKW